MGFNLKKSKGQTFVEFLLVFVVLFAAASGAFVMYKKVWKSRYEKTGFFSGMALAAAKVGGVGDVEFLGKKIKTDYVK